MNDDGYNDYLEIKISINGIDATIKSLKILLAFNVSLSVRFVYILDKYFMIYITIILYD